MISLGNVCNFYKVLYIYIQVIHINKNIRQFLYDYHQDPKQGKNNQV